jgi:NAD(P)H dehydrogenase (quinone)
MTLVLVAYFSKSGNTKRMAEAVADGARSSGAEVHLMPVEEVDVDSLDQYDAIILGSPTYYGTMAAPIKRLVDESVALHGQLNGKVGGAFTSSAQRAGGNETTIIDILKALLIHGMCVQGTPGADHYGPVAVGAPDEMALESANEYGLRLAKLAARL